MANGSFSKLYVFQSLLFKIKPGKGGMITVYTLDGTVHRNSSGSMINITVPMVTGSVDGGHPGQMASPGKPGVSLEIDTSLCQQYRFANLPVDLPLLGVGY